MGKGDMAALARTRSELSRGGDSLPGYILTFPYIVTNGLTAYSDTETTVYNRKKDQESTTGKWFAELIKPNPWYNKVVPDVSASKNARLTKQLTHWQVS
jgi:hypothetical protein